jgi:hypothetical protein
MKTVSMRAIMTACFLICLSGSMLAWEKEEHLAVSNSAFKVVLSRCGGAIHDSFIFIPYRDSSIRLEKTLWKNKTFGEICAYSAGNDFSYSRYQQRGLTTLQQLEPISCSLIDRLWSELSGAKSADNITQSTSHLTVRSAEQSNTNVVANYLLHHLIALRFAEFAGGKKSEDKESLRCALVYEAMAQSYLSDAFSSSHMLVPSNDVFFSLHPVNNKEAHNFYRNEGAFVVNARGDAWQTFGNKLLQWYAPTYIHVHEACVTSLCELFLVYYVSVRNGDVPKGLKEWAHSISDEAVLSDIVKEWTITQEGEKYYSVTKMPTLLLLPMPVSAVWSVRTEEVDDHGIHRRKHYPQLREPGFHDPDFKRINTEFIYPLSTVPDWMIPKLLPKKSPEELIRSHPDYASVRYVQQVSFPPSYKGLVFRFGGGLIHEEAGTGLGSVIGLGYGLVDDLLLLNKVSVDVVFSPTLDEAQRLLITPTLGLGIKMPAPFKLWEALHIDVGYAIGLRSPLGEDGVKLGIGIESPTIPLGFTYMGLTIRLTYQKFSLEQTKRGIFLEFLFH